MRQLPIYSAERDAGLTDILSDPSHSALSFASQALVSEAKISDEQHNKALSYIKKMGKTEASNLNQFDLFYLNTILVTVGWNKNDDVFLKNETWAARNTPEDKPFNFEHNPRITIGHITGSCVIDEDGSVIADNTAVDEIPDKFHVLTNAVIYRHINSKDEELEQQIAELIDNIRRGKWFVSMEALFSDFDYAVTHASGLQEIVARNKDTAFLTKHLRVYGGKGVFHDKKIGRAVKNITFSGKGLVETPANPESIIFDSVETFSGVFANTCNFDVSNEPPQTKELTMADVVDNAALQHTIAELKAELKKLDVEKVQAKYNSYDTVIAKRDSDLSAYADKIKELEENLKSIGASVDGLEGEKSDLAKELETAKASLSEKQEELDAIAAEALKVDRVSALVDKGVDKVEAEAIIAKFAGLSDEQFEAIVETHAALVEAKFNFDKKEDGKDDKKTDKKDKKKADASSDDESDDDDASAAQAALDDAEASGDATLQTPGDSEEDVQEQLVASLSDYFAEVTGTNETSE